MLRANRKPRTTGERMVANNYNAILYVREHQDEPLTPEMLLELQSILTEGTLTDPGQVGRFRVASDQVAVVDPQDGEVMHDPPHASELEHRLSRLCEFANPREGLAEFVHPVVRACVLHFQIGFDHPFCDGNGRTARAIFYWSMLRSGYWMFEYLPISRLIIMGPAKYARAYLNCEVDEFDVTYFLIYHLGIIARARRDLRIYLQRKQSQIAESRRLLGDDPDLNHRQREVVMQVTRNPDRAFTIAKHASAYACAYGTARSDLMELAIRGYLRQTRVGRRFEFVAGPKIRS